MCGIYGIVLHKEVPRDPVLTKKLVRALSTLSESRGKEASGIATLYDQTLHVYKTPLSSSKMAGDATYRELIDASIKSGESFVFFGHSRLATHGSHSDSKNNQPVCTESSVGVHNGICTNFVKLQKQLKQREPRSQLDSYVLFSLLDQEIDRSGNLAQAITKTFLQLEGSASIAYMHTHSSLLCLATNTGSLYYMHQDGSHLIFASERYILSQIQERFAAYRHLKIQQLKPRTALLLDCLSLRSSMIQLRENNNKKSIKTSQQDSPYFKIREYSTPTIRKTISREENSLEAIREHVIDTAPIKALRRCTRCILPETMPLIQFDEDGVCNYCRSTKPIMYKGEAALQQLCDLHRKNDGNPDCIVALSGGRDSAYGLHFVKNILGMNPVAYTYDWGMITDVGRSNQARMVGKLGVEHIIVSADIAYKRDNIRRNVLAWLEQPDLGMVPLFMAGDKQAEYYAQQLMRKTDIPLAIYCRGNELENEEFKWGHCGIRNGSPKGVLHNLSTTGKLQLAAYYGTQFLKNPKYLNRSLLDTAFAYAVAYMMPLDFLYLWHYVPWDEDTIISTLESEYGWQRSSETGVTWRIDDGSVAFYNYIFYAVQGFTENDTFRSNQVRHGMMTRDQALALVEKENAPRYESLKWYFDAIDLNGDEVLTRIDQIPKLYSERKRK